MNSGKNQHFSDFLEYIYSIWCILWYNLRLKCHKCQEVRVHFKHDIKLTKFMLRSGSFWHVLRYDTTTEDPGLGRITVNQSACPRADFTTWHFAYILTHLWSHLLRFKPNNRDSGKIWDEAKPRNRWFVRFNQPHVVFWERYLQRQVNENILAMKKGRRILWRL